MSFQLLKPYYTSNNSSSKKKPSNALPKKKAEHDNWLRENGVHPDQLKNAANHKNKIPSYKTEKVNFSNEIIDGGRATGIMVNLHKESDATRNEILRKASRVVSLYNKGPTMYMIDSEDLTKIGSLSRSS